MDKTEKRRRIRIAASTVKSTPLAQPPPPLAQAIANASKTFNVPPDLLTGIWRVESGSTYPNPYVNSSGYGGLFGTTNWNATTQDQANLSAYILSQALKNAGGNVAQALSAYSGGGYTSVPGQQTQGTIANYNPTFKPYQGSGYKPVSNPVSGVPILGSIVGAGESVGQTAGNVVDSSSSIGKDVLYGLAFIGGGLLILGGLILIGADIGIGAFRAAKKSAPVQVIQVGTDKLSPSRRQTRADTEARQQRSIQVKSETQEARLYQAQQNAENARQRRLATQQRVKRERARNKPIKGDIPF